MKRFLAKVALLALLAAFLAVGLSLSAYPEHPTTRFGGEVFRAIRRCTTASPEARVLVLGDSVANQVFSTGPRLPPRITVAVSNQAVTPIGNRILLDRWLALNPQAEEVVYALIPGSLNNDGLRRFTFHYLIHPFSETGLLDSAPDDVRAHLAHRFGGLVLANRSLRHLLYRNDRLYDVYERRIVRVPNGDGGVPPMVVSQLRAMRDACAARGVRFRLVFLPVSSANNPSRTFRKRCAKQLRDIVPDIDALFAELRIEPKDNFQDDVHFTRKRLAEIQERLRADILGEYVR